MNKKAFRITLMIMLLAVPLWAVGEDAKPSARRFDARETSG